MKPISQEIRMEIAELFLDNVPDYAKPLASKVVAGKLQEVSDADFADGIINMMAWAAERLFDKLEAADIERNKEELAYLSEATKGFSSPARQEPEKATLPKES